MFLDQASALYERATSGMLSKSMLLHFAYADFEEQQSRFDRVHQIYQKYLSREDIDPTLVRTKDPFALCSLVLYTIRFQCYVQYMKFCRRSESTMAARQIFKKAREDPRSSSHAYAAAALMEYYCTKDKKIAGNVFELGFKKFKADEKFVTAYIDYLSHLNGKEKVTLST